MMINWYNYDDTQSFNSQHWPEGTSVNKVGNKWTCHWELLTPITCIDDEFDDDSPFDSIEKW